ncbi:MAG: 2-phospho-L-lactate guanylyltransferase [Gammaproteobacteria bacterium]|nr:2-phospho-L-lactate guanylyltransferase [Gammaproteobacteria bacterium]
MWAIIPINEFSRSFTRLSSVLDLEQRMELAKNLSSRLIQILLAVDEVEKIVLFTCEKNWPGELQHSKLVLRKDEDKKPLKQKIDSVADWAYGSGAKKMMYLSIDLPIVEKKDITQIIDSHKHGLTLVQAKKDGGTNALIADLPRKINFQFGADSFRKHLEAAKLEKLKTNIQSAEGLSFDLDDHDDWEFLIKYYQPEKNPLKI